MRVTRMVAGSTTIITAVLGLSLATAGPAAAAEGSWRPYGNTNPITSSPATWRCASTEEIATNVAAQVCAVRSEGGGAVQGAVIVRNNRSSSYRVQAEMYLYNSSGQLGYWECSSSGVGANSWSVCFGRTISQNGSVYSPGAANGENLGTSPRV